MLKDFWPPCAPKLLQFPVLGKCEDVGMRFGLFPCFILLICTCHFWESWVLPNSSSYIYIYIDISIYIYIYVYTSHVAWLLCRCSDYPSWARILRSSWLLPQKCVDFRALVAGQRPLVMEFLWTQLVIEFKDHMVIEHGHAQNISKCKSSDRQGKFPCLWLQ